MESRRTVPGGQYERRIGRRHTIAVPLRWQVEPGRGRRGRTTLHQVTSDNLSVNGAGYVDEIEPELRIGSRIRLTINDAVGSALVRNMTPTGDTRHCMYGIEFVDDSLVAEASSIVSEHLATHPEARPAAPSPATPTRPQSFGSSDDLSWG